MILDTERIERNGVVLERWQWESLGPDLADKLRGAAPTGCSFVYFAQEVGGDDAVKIGVATDPEKRLATLQTGNPRRLVIRRVVIGDRLVEQRWHRLWKRRNAHIRDEWFSEADAILRLAEHIAQLQYEVLERGVGVERGLAACMDRGLKAHREVGG